jgi:hypothetical protein
MADIGHRTLSETRDTARTTRPSPLTPLPSDGRGAFVFEAGDPGWRAARLPRATILLPHSGRMERSRVWAVCGSYLIAHEPLF